LRLRKEGVFLTEIKESTAEEQVVAPGTSVSRGVSSQDITIMSRQVATLVAAGIPLVESLTALVDQVENLKLKRRSRTSGRGERGEFARRRDAGASEDLLESLREHGSRGEASGALEVVLNRLADFSENQTRLRGKIVATMAYPAIMLFIGGAALIIIFTFVIPKLVRLYRT